MALLLWLPCGFTRWRKAASVGGAALAYGQLMGWLMSTGVLNCSTRAEKRTYRSGSVQL